LLRVSLDFNSNLVGSNRTGLLLAQSPSWLGYVLPFEWGRTLFAIAPFHEDLWLRLCANSCEPYRQEKGRIT
ncbi:MAG: hypothetical protein ACI9TA_003401, partial [Reinekea sp.]